MGTWVSISHKTVYSYDRPVILGPQLIRLKPAAHSRTKVLAYSLNVSPAKDVAERFDVVGLPTYVILKPKAR